MPVPSREKNGLGSPQFPSLSQLGRFVHCVEADIGVAIHKATSEAGNAAMKYDFQNTNGQLSEATATWHTLESFLVFG